MNPKPIQFTSKKTSNYYPNYPIQLPSTMKKLRSNCYPTTIQLASNYHPIICYIAMEATAHRNRWLKWWFTVTTVFEMVIFHSYAQQSTIQLPSNSPVFMVARGGSSVHVLTNPAKKHQSPRRGMWRRCKGWQKPRNSQLEQLELRMVAFKYVETMGYTLQ
jgi:hypothetical protein